MRTRFLDLYLHFHFHQNQTDVHVIVALKEDFDSSKRFFVQMLFLLIVISMQEPVMIIFIEII
jgi:hypothetical protein